MTIIRPLRNRVFSMLAATQSSNLAATDHVEFLGTAADTLGTLISLSSGAGQTRGIFTLQPATYKITAHVALTLTAATDSVVLRLTNGAGVALVPDSAGDPFLLMQGMADTAVTTPASPIEVIFTTGSVFALELRIVSVSGTLVGIGTGTEMMVEQIVT